MTRRRKTIHLFSDLREGMRKEVAAVVVSDLVDRTALLTWPREVERALDA
jgi:hypothetical protein